jgi:Ala-tRNA(Pro) deacylase
VIQHQSIDFVWFTIYEVGEGRTSGDEAGVSYEVYNHPLAYTAQEIAARQHFSGNEMAKVVMLKLDGNLLMAVVTGSHKISLNTVKTSLGAREVRLATEHEFISRFPECEIGAKPPFGNLFDLSVVVDPALERLCPACTPAVARLVEVRKRAAAESAGAEII